MSGILIRNQDTYIVIDGDNHNFELYAIYGVVTSSTLIDTSYGSLTVNGLPGMPMVACLGNGNGASARVASYNPSNGNTVITFCANGAAGASVTLYVFSRPTSQYPHNGLRVWDANAKLVFTGSGKHVAIARTITGIPSNVAGDVAVATVSAGKTYACMFFNDGFNQKSINQAAGGSITRDWWNYNFRAFFKQVGTTIYLSSGNFQAVHFGDVSPPPEYSKAMTGFLIDISNY